MVPSDLETLSSGSSLIVRRNIQAKVLEKAFHQLEASAVLKEIIVHGAAGRSAVVTSFGAESAVLLHLVSDIAADAPVIFVDTGRHFGETKRYGESLCDRLGLTNVRVVSPVSETILREDPEEFLFRENSDRCCSIRKQAPLSSALERFDCWVSGRKQYQGATRDRLKMFEYDGDHIKVNPLAAWKPEEIRDYFDKYDLPRHPLEQEGYRSIGCMPCTDRVSPGEDARAGRWRGLSKRECGIHKTNNTSAQA